MCNHDLHTHLKRKRDLIGSFVRISRMSSSGRKGNGSGGVIGSGGE